jgi:hypothetical protein
MATRTEVSRPPFVADWKSINRDTGHTIDWANVGERFRSTPGQIVKLNGAVAADVSPLTVDAIEFAIPAGTLIYFGQLGETVRVTTLAAAGATSLVVEADHTALEDNDEGTITGSGYKMIPAGTRMGAAGTNGRIYPRVETSNPAQMILATNAREDGEYGSRDSYGAMVAGVLWENLLPGATGTPKVIPTAEKTELATAGCFFTFKQHRDSTA